MQSKNGRVQTLYVFLRSDETPMKMCVLDMDCLFGLPSGVVEMLGDLWGEVAADRDMGVSKLLQTEVTVVLLVEVSGAWRMFSWRRPLPIQSGGRGTAECYYQAMTSWFLALDLQEIAMMCNRRHVLFCTDREGAQAKGQRCHSRA